MIQPEVSLETFDLIEAAACLWEHALEDTYTHVHMDMVGAAEWRAQVISLAAFCHEGWEIAAKNGFCDSFDFEFVPEFWASCVFPKDGKVFLIDNWRDECAAIGQQSTQRSL